MAPTAQEEASSSTARPPRVSLRMFLSLLHSIAVFLVKWGKHWVKKLSLKVFMYFLVQQYAVTDHHLVGGISRPSLKTLSLQVLWRASMLRVCRKRGYPQR